MRINKVFLKKSKIPSIKTITQRILGTLNLEKLPLMLGNLTRAYLTLQRALKRAVRVLGYYSQA